MVRLAIGYPEGSIERSILEQRTTTLPVEAIEAMTDDGQVEALQKMVGAVRVDPLVLDYLMAMIQASRSHPDITLGVSTRGALELQKACRARALVCGRNYVLLDDVKHLAGPVLAHRIKLPGQWDAMTKGPEQAEAIIAELLDAIPVPV